MLPYPNKLKSKLPNAFTTIFTVMSALAHEHNAINLSQGFPDFLCDERLMNKVDEYVRKGFNQYAPMPGLLKLREKIATKAFDLYGIDVNPESEVTITAGGTEAIFSAITAVVHPGDEVIVLEPAYDCYVPAIELCGATAIYVSLEAPDYKVNWERVRKLINPKTRMIMINTPHNPTGTVLEHDDMNQLKRLVRDTGIMILSDEVYEHILFDGKKHESVLRYPELAERSFVVFSFGKTYHNTGWKMGYVIAPAEMSKEFRRVHQFNVFSCNTPYQHAFADIMDDKDLYLSLPEFYQQKRDFFCKLLRDTPFKFKPADGSYFQLVNYSDITNEGDKDFAIRLTKEIGVASVPISVFYHEGLDMKMLRICFAKNNETLERAVERLTKLKVTA
jgi:methionine transaminase